MKDADACLLSSQHSPLRPFSSSSSGSRHHTTATTPRPPRLPAPLNVKQLDQYQAPLHLGTISQLTHHSFCLPFRQITPHTARRRRHVSLLLVAATVLIICRAPSATASATPDNGPPRLRRTLLTSPSLPSVTLSSLPPPRLDRYQLRRGPGQRLSTCHRGFCSPEREGYLPHKDLRFALNSSILNAEATIGFSSEEMLSLASNASLALEALRPLQPFDSLIKYIALASEPNESLPS